MGRRALFALDLRQAEEVRRRRRAGETWRSIAASLGWSCPNPALYIKNALRRAPKPHDDGGCWLRREAAVAMAEADPVLSRRCAKCGVPNYRLRKISEDYWDPVAVGFERLGGRWLCPDCAPRRARPEEPVCEAYADPYRIGRIR